MFTRHGTRALTMLGAVGVILGLGACGGTVKEEQYNSDMAKLREEMQAGNKDLGSKIDATDATVAEHSRRLDALEGELQAFRSEFNVSIEKTRSMLRFAVPVHFEFAGSDLREEDRPVLDRFATVVKDFYPGALITVEGFTDPAGSAAYNKELGMRRAESVREYLGTSGGLGGDLLRAVSYGEARNRQVVADAKGPGEEGVENRRVALVVDHAAIATDQVSAIE